MDVLNPKRPLASTGVIIILIFCAQHFSADPPVPPPPRSCTLIMPFTPCMYKDSNAGVEGTLGGSSKDWGSLPAKKQPVVEESGLLGTVEQPRRDRDNSLWSCFRCRFHVL